MNVHFLVLNMHIVQHQINIHHYPVNKKEEND